MMSRVSQGLKNAIKFVRPNFRQRWNEATDDGGLRREIATGYRGLGKHVRGRLKNPGQFPETFAELLSAWGIAEHQIPTVIRNLRIQAALTGTVALLCVAAGLNELRNQNLLYGLLYPAIGVGLVFAASVPWWRASLLAGRNAKPYLTWLMRAEK